MDLTLLALLRSAFFLLRLLPQYTRLALLTILARLVFSLMPKYAKIARTNIDRAFPEKTTAEREQIYRQSIREHARLISDIIRMPQLDKEWVTQHVHFPNLEAYKELQEQKGEKGILIATGHLGSFEILSRSGALYGYPLSFVARNFTLPKVDRWWRKERERYGNEMINRKGAYKKAISRLRAGRDVGLLIDQNVTRNRATFVDLFGVPAATTKALALAALQTTPPVIVASIQHTGEDNYTVNWQQVDMQDVYEDTEASREEKVFEITKRVSEIYEDMIRKDPPAWFWMHRRWKTRPSENDPAFY